MKNGLGTLGDLPLVRRIWNGWGHHPVLEVITERIAAQEQLHESEEQYRALINSTSDGVFVAQDERFIFYNEALPAMLGYTFEEFTDMSFEKVIAPEHVDLWTSRFRQRIAGENVVSSYQVQFLDKTGTKKIWIELRANLINHAVIASSAWHGPRYHRPETVH